jgi:hypothetical protein
MLIDQRHEALHELVSFEIRDSSERHASAEVVVAVRVASGTSQRTLTGDLDRNVRAVARKDATPRLNQFASANVVRHVAAYYLLP